MIKDVKHSEETKKKMRKAQKKIWSNYELRKRQSKITKKLWARGIIVGMTGKHHSEESIRKQKKTLMKTYLSNPELRKKMSKITKKLWNNQKFRKRQVEARKGQHSSPKTEFKKGLIPWMKGRKHSEKTKEKIIITLKKRFPNGRQLNSGNFEKGLNPWNKGRIYSEKERNAISKATKKGMANPKVIEKLRRNTLKMYESGKFPRQENTKPERQIKEELIKIGYKEGTDFIHQYKFMNKFMCDFCFPQQKLIIEVDGDFWHANPKKYPLGSSLHPHQIKGMGKDKAKTAYIKKVDDGSWTLLRFWESDINKNVSECVDKIEEVLTEKKRFK